MKHFLTILLVLLCFGSYSLTYSADAQDANSAAPADAQEAQAFLSQECAVCLEELYPLEVSDFSTITTLPVKEVNGRNTCGHSFHTNCLVGAAERGFFCPTCRTPYESDLIPELPEVSLDLGALNLEIDENGILNLYEREITTLRGLQLLPNQERERVQIIDVDSNLITQVPTGVFSAFSNLRELCFDNNQSLITFQDATVFAGLGALEDLSFENCRLAIIPEGSFDQLTNLRYLNISGNRFETFTPGLFSQLHNLKVLDVRNLANMSDDEKARIREEIGIAAPTCRVYFQDSDVPEIVLSRITPGNDLRTQFFGLIEDLDLSSKEINSLEGLADFALKDDVRTLDLSDNVINYVGIDQEGRYNFEEFGNLQRLNLSHNVIDFVEDDAFASLLSLTHLYMHNNFYQELPQGLFTPLTQLQVAWLSTSLLNGERIRIRQEINAVAPMCHVLFIQEELSPEYLSEEDQDGEGTSEDDDQESDDSQDDNISASTLTTGSDSDDDDDDENPADMSLVSYEEEPGQ